jgi:oligoendopeptidase F
VAELDQAEFEHFLDCYQGCVHELQRSTSYAELAVACGVLTSEGVAALARCDLAWAKLAEALSFVEPELTAMPTALAEQHPVLAPGGSLHNFYRRVLATSSQDDKVATALAAMRPSGVDGWQTLARQLLSRIKIATADGVASIGSIMPKLYQLDRSGRRQVQTDITEALAKELELRATALSMIVLDGLTRAELTGTSWLDEALVSDQLTAAEVDALVAGAAAGYPIIHDYYELKARLLGQQQLDEADRYAPVGEDSGQISWTQATETVLAAFDAVHPRCGAAARQLLAANRVDAANRPGKATGPFTKEVPGDLPWISVNFNGSLRHVLLLAHELGHGVHMMMSAHLPVLAATTPRVLAETVALFFESATLAQLERFQAPTSAVTALLARWVEDQAVAICRHAAIFRFEVALRERMKAAGYLDTGMINELWLSSQRELYGPAMAISESFAGWWSCLDGLYQSPGSSYAYLYGQFAAAALVEQQAMAGTDFGDRLLALMTAGGSAPPRELLQRAGIDPLAPVTWQAGLAALRKRVSALNVIAADLSRQRHNPPACTHRDQ